MAKIGSLFAELGLDSTKFKTGLEQARRDLSSKSAQMKKSIIGLEKTFDTIKGAIFSVQGAIAGLAGAAVVGAITDVVKSYDEANASVILLNRALQDTGRLSAEATAKITESAAQIQAMTTIEDDSLVKATAKLALLGDQLRPDELVKAQKAIAGLADTFFDGDVEKAATLLGKSIGSNTNALKRYGIEVDANATQADKLNQIMGQTATFFGQSEAKATTLHGQITQLNNVWGDLKEALGEVIFKMFDGTKSTGGLKDAIVNTTKYVKENMDSFVNLGKSIGNLVAQFFNLLGVLFKANPVFGPLIENVRKMLNDLGNGDPVKGMTVLINGLANSFKWLSQKINEAQSGIAAFFKAGQNQAENNLKKAKESIEAMKGLFNQASGGFKSGKMFAYPETQTVSFGKLPEDSAATINENLQGFMALENALQNYGQKFEDVFFNGLKEGEFKFKEFAASIIEDIGRMAFKMMVLKPLFGGMDGNGDFKSGLVGTGVNFLLKTVAGAFKLPGFAEGGYMSAGKPAIVGERGPELIVPRGGANVIPNHALGGVTQHFHFEFSSGVDAAVQAHLRASMPTIRREAESGVIAAQGRGGAMAKAMGNRA